MFGIGGPELIIIFLVILIVIGPRRLPEIARSLGRLYRQFQRSLDELRENLDFDQEPEPDEKGKKPEADKDSRPDDLSRAP